MVYFLSFLQIFYATPIDAMEALLKEGTVLVSPKIVQSMQPGLSSFQVTPNKEGTYSLALDPGLWSSDQKIVLLDGERPIGMINSEKGQLNILGSEAPLVLDGRISTQEHLQTENSQKNFYDFPLPENENGIFHSWNLSREQGIQFLIEKLYEPQNIKEQYLNLLSPAIQDAFLTGSFPWLSQSHLTSSSPDLQNLYALQKDYQAGKIFQSALKDLTHSPKVCRYYLEHLRDKNLSDKHPSLENVQDNSLLKAIARAQGHNISIWEKQENGVLKPIFEYIWDSTEPYHHFLSYRENGICSLKGLKESRGAQAYGPLSVISQGPVKVLGGLFVNGGMFDVQKLSLDSDIESYLPWKGWCRQGDVTLDGTFRGLSDLFLKGRNITNNQSTWAHSILLDFQNGVNGPKGDFKAEQDIILGTSLFESSMKGNAGFKKFINLGTLRTKRLVKLNVDDFEGENSSRIFAGVLHHFQGTKYHNSGKLYTPNVSLVQCTGDAYFGKEFYSDTNQFFVIAKNRLETYAIPGKSSSQIIAASKIMMDSQTSLIHKGSMILRTIGEAQVPYYQYEVGAGATPNEIGNIKQNYEEHRINSLPYQINQYKKDIDLSNLSKGVGVFLSSPSLRQEGTISSYTGEMKYHGQNILISGKTNLVNHFLQNKIQVQGVNVILEGTLRGAYQTSFHLQNHFYLKGGAVKKTNLDIQSNTATLSGFINVNRTKILTTSSLIQEKTNHLKAEDALLKSGIFLKSDGVNDIQNTFVLQSPQIQHEALTQALSFYLMGNDVGISGEVLVKLIQASAVHSISYNATTSASDAQFNANTIDLHKVMNAETFQAIAKNTLTSDMDFKDTTSIIMNAENSLRVGGDFQNCGTMQLTTKGHGVITATIQGEFLKAEAFDLDMFGQNYLSKTLVAEAKRNLDASSTDKASFLHYSAGNELDLAGHKNASRLIAFTQGSLSSIATIESEILEAQGFDTKLSGENKTSKSSNIRALRNLIADGKDSSPILSYSAVNNMHLEGEKICSQIIAVAQRHLESTANIESEDVTFLKGHESASIGGEIGSSGKLFIESDGSTKVPANLNSANVNVQGNNVALSGHNKITDTLRVDAIKDLKSSSNDTARLILLSAGGDMALSGQKTSENMKAVAFGHLQSDADIHTTKETYLEGITSSRIGGSIASKNTTLLSQGKESVSADINSHTVAVNAYDIDLSWKAKAQNIAAVANSTISHSGKTSSDTLYLKSKSAHLGGEVENHQQVTTEVDEISTNWTAILNKLVVSGNNLTLGGEVSAQDVFLTILDVLHIKDEAFIQNLQARAKTLIKDGNLEGQQAFFDIEKTANLHGTCDMQDRFQVRAGKLVLQQAHLISNIFDLIAKDIAATDSSLKADKSYIEAPEGIANLKGLTINSTKLLSLKAGEAELNPDLITTETSDIHLGHYKDGIKGVIKLAHDLVHCKNVRFDAKTEDLTIDQPTEWRPNITIFVKNVDVQAPLKSQGLIEIESENGFDISDSIIAENLYLRAKKKDITCNLALLKAVQNIYLQADEASIIGIGTKILAEHGELVMKAALDVVLESLAQRFGNDKNYHDEKIQSEAKSGTNLEVSAGRNIELTSVETHSGNNTTLTAGQNTTDRALTLESQITARNKHSSTQDKYVHQAVSKHETNGKFLSQAGGKQNLDAPKITATEISLLSVGAMAINEVHDRHEHEYHFRKKGNCLQKNKTIDENSLSIESIGAKLTSTKPTEITSGDDMKLTNVSLNTPEVIITTDGVLQILLGTNYYSASKMESNSNVAWKKQTNKIEEHQTYTPPTITGKVKINSKETILQTVLGKTLDFINQIDQNGGKLTHTTLKEFHHVDEKTVQGPTQALAAVVALAVSICTLGTGAAAAVGLFAASCTTGLTATVVSGMAAAAFTSLCSQGALALLNNQGDIRKAAKSLACTDTLKSIGISVLSAGLTASLSDTFNIPTDPKGFVDHLHTSSMNAGIKMTTGMAIQGQKFETAFKDAIKGLAIDTFSATFANDIKKLYEKEGNLNFLTHKIAHGVLGGATGFALDGKSGICSGALGGMVAEAVAEFSIDREKVKQDVILDHEQEGRPLTDASFNEGYKKKLRPQTDLIRLLTSTTSMFAGLDPSITNYAATNAIENNFALIIPPAAWGLACLASGITAIIMSINKVTEDFGKINNQSQENYINAVMHNQSLNPESSNSNVCTTPIHDSKPSIMCTPIHDSAPTILITPVQESRPILEEFDPRTESFPLPGYEIIDMIDTSISDATIHITYTKTNKETGQVYSGRTRGEGEIQNERDLDIILNNRDRSHHMNQFGYGPAIIDKVSLNYKPIRGREQILVDQNGGAQSKGGTSGNRINGISDKNPNLPKYMDSAKKEFGNG